jgi:hypothetical protein
MRELFSSNSTFMSSRTSIPGPTSSMIFLNSSSVKFFGTLPINNLFFVSDIEHLKVFPCRQGYKVSLKFKKKNENKD